MTDYFVDGGRADDTGSGLTWALAKKTLQAALTLATGTGDRVIVKYNALSTTDAEVGADTAYTFGGNISLISASADDTGTAFTPTVMGTAYWIGNSTATRTVRFTGNFAAYIYGLTLRNAGTGADRIAFGASSSDYTFDSCYGWCGTTDGSTLSGIYLGDSSSAVVESKVRLVNCTFRFGATGQSFESGSGSCIIEGGSISSDGSTPTLLFESSGGVGGAGITEVVGFDASLVTGTLCGGVTDGYRRFVFAQCKLGSGVTVMAAQTTNPHGGAIDVFIHDCASGDEHYHFQHHNALGSLTTDTGVYVTADGAAYNAANARASWKIVTTANATYASPYISPWISVHHEGTSAITPYLEGVVTTTAPKNDEIWGEFLFKGTSGFTTGTIDRTDKRALTAAAADQTASSLTASDWTGEPATPQFFKLNPASAITPAEIGDLAARVCVGKASTTYYIDPQIRGRS